MVKELEMPQAFLEQKFLSIFDATEDAFSSFQAHFNSKRPPPNQSFISAVMMGLMLHSNAKQLTRRQKYEDALEVLAMGEVRYWCSVVTYDNLSIFGLIQYQASMLLNL
ncbi:uncharacterized protein LOC104445802 isoform X2 [Eucalyptus grandis]|uniref:uncharacterized protein LOC104445802 isoform X2 n=1 Tax=Eucalyptus grandis TaxID=71139 RepID=UPI00192E7863|nr:uncharacterized protein LOC104445802 isoform X2 [Eucalyptus grandis]